MGRSHDIARGALFKTQAEDDTRYANVSGDTFTGAVTIDENGATALTVDRATSDGDIIAIQKNGSTVGSIGTGTGSELAVSTTSGTQYISQKLNGDTDGLQYSSSGTYHFGPWLSKDNAVDLGRSNGRFRDVFVGNAVKTSAAQFNSAGTYTPDVYTARNDNYFEGYRSCLGFFAPGAGNPYIHLKTNLPDNGNKMIKFEWNGFTYSGTNSHNSVTFYTYSGTNSPYNPIHQNWGNGHGIVNYYYSSDNYVVIVCQASGSYTGGFLYVQSGRSHIWYSPDITTASNSGNISGVY